MINTGCHLMQMKLSPAQQAYYELVWGFVRQVPYGQVVTYGQIAQALPEPEGPELEEAGARLVGSAMAACPDDVPWHRVINAQGSVSSRAEASCQMQLLEAEGLCFIRGRLSLEEHQWLGSDQASKPKQQSLF